MPQPNSDVLTKKQIEALFREKDGPELAVFTKGFYHRLWEASPQNATNKRSPFKHRLDSMARLLVGNETMAGVAFDGQQLQVATNRNSHLPQRIQYRMFCVISRHPDATNIFRIRTGVELQSSASELVRVEYARDFDYRIISRENVLRLDKDQPTSIVLCLSPLVHGIQFIDVNLDITAELNREIPYDENMKKDLANRSVVWQGPWRDISFNPLQRRAEQLLEHMWKAHLLARWQPTSEQKQINPEKLFIDSEQALLKESLSWEAARWFRAKKYDPFPKTYRGSSKEQVDQAVEILYTDFLRFRKTQKKIEDWVDETIAKVNSGELKLPALVADDTASFLKKTKRYFVDLPKLAAFVKEEQKNDTAFSRWLQSVGGLQENATFGLRQGVVRIVDDLPDNVHAELRILYDYMTRGSRPEYIATALLCCAHCKLIMDVKNFSIAAEPIAAEPTISGTHGRAYPGLSLALDQFSDLDPNFLQDVLGAELFATYSALTSKQQTEAKKIMGSVAALSSDNRTEIGITCSLIWNTHSTLPEESDDENGEKTP